MELSKTFFTHFESIRMLQLYSFDFTYVASDAFDKMKNLQALGIIDSTNMSHIEFNGLPRLKWLELELIHDTSPFFSQINPDLEVFICYLRSLTLKSEEKTKLFEIFNSCKLMAFLFWGCRKFDFDFELLYGKNIEHIGSSSLRYLRLSHLKSLKGSLSGLVNLQLLNLHDIEFIEFQPGMFNELVKLRTLNMSNNPTLGQMLSPGLFNGLVRLQRLEMVNCSLKRLPNGLFSPLKRLKKLDLQYNKELETDEDTFKDLNIPLKFISM